MRRFLAIGLAFLLSTTLPGLAARPDAPERFIVGFDHTVGPADGSMLERHGAEVLRLVPNADLAVVRADRGHAFAEAIRAQAGVRFVEVDAPVFLEASSNDQYFNSHQWGPQAIQAPQAWDVTFGSLDVVYGVVDTGVDYLHPDLATAMWLNALDPPNGVDDDANGYVDDTLGWDCSDHDNDPNGYEQSHGTHVAGIAAARTNNAYGIAGVAQVRIMALKMFGSGSFNSAAAECIRYGADNGARVLGMSWFTTPSQAIDEAIRHAWAKGVVLVKSAGNQGNSGPVTYPGTLPEVIAVSALSRPGDVLASYSSTGSKVEVAAPGTGILSSIPVSGGSTGGLATPFHASFSGTSMAQPHASAVACLILSKNPALTNVEVRAILGSTADDLGAAGRDPQFGFGRINAHAAVLAA
jgi:thermitase